MGNRHNREAKLNKNTGNFISSVVATLVSLMLNFALHYHEADS